ncbi:MerR family transcriptional regulator [Thermoflavimicrobium dichotomicum]|uniref:MerR HTH family regulatory protein n=1 Tax=Thermoflavimicrobium dichotomicum TaxID=46223 RepID=A0A1I3LAY8_9BACL|nr:MerR family transcriptional regulator [Thermoflavimicrobium dichotomicum]SFI81720.1 MerR HTH family regulatory protein [Thermoflavimicrobium dichotomicum]
MVDLTIGQIASKAKVNPSTIRYYESIRLLPEPKRVNGQRRYSDDILNRIKFIRSLNKQDLPFKKSTLF